jgi:putative FmdB family regulatory protein
VATYEYICVRGHENLIERPMSEPEGNPTCSAPECSESLKRVFSTPSISFKGRGFYSTGG